MKTPLFYIAKMMGTALFSCEKKEDDRVMDNYYNPVIVPANFNTEVTNTYFPLVQGKTYTYSSQTTEGTETVGTNEVFELVSIN